MNIKHTVLFVVTLAFITACKPQKDLNYLKDIEDIAVETSIKSTANTIQPGDNLEIMISAEDMEVVAPFNQNYSSSNSGAGSMPRNTNTDRQPAYYTVDSNGDVTMPILGQISTTGLTNEEFRSKLTGMLRTYVKTPVVAVRTVNFKVTVLGEVARPGTYTVPDGNITLPSALGLAGDLTIYGERDNVLIVRNENGQTTKERINLTSAEYLSSPFFYLKQNDLIYVSSNETRQKASNLDPNISIYIAVASVALGLMALLIR